MKRLMVLVLVTACGMQGPSATPDAAGGPGTYRVTWSDGHSDSPGVPAPVVCTTTISHPCPLQLYEHELIIAADGTLTWTDGSGGADDNGVSAADKGPIVEQPGTALAPQGSIILAMHGDDGGLRHAAVLAPTDGGFSGDVVWTLDTVAGNTSFHVVVAH